MLVLPVSGSGKRDQNGNTVCHSFPKDFVTTAPPCRTLAVTTSDWNSNTRFQSLISLSTAERWPLWGLLISTRTTLRIVTSILSYQCHRYFQVWVLSYDTDCVLLRRLASCLIKLAFLLLLRSAELMHFSNSTTINWWSTIWSMDSNLNRDTNWDPYRDIITDPNINANRDANRDANLNTNIQHYWGT